MSHLADVLHGFAEIWTAETLLWCLIGVVVGTLIGVLPGLGPVGGIAVLLPVSFTLDTVAALALLMGIYQGAMYGGRISSILINVPGEPSAVVTTFEGYPMTKSGRAGYALSLSAVASFVGGMLGFAGLAFLMPVISDWATMFGPPEFFALMVFALVATSGIGTGNLLKGLISLGLGLLVGLIGLDPVTGDARMTYGSVDLWDGVSFVAIAVGAFGFAEVLALIRGDHRSDRMDEARVGVRGLLPGGRDLARNAGSIARGSAIGYFVGLLPGAGSTIATFLSYSSEKRIAKKPEKFGSGVEQGLSGPESANNASIGGALVPLFTLGIPGSAVTAVLLGALVTVGLEPGPRMLTESGDIIYAAVAGLVIANVILLVLNTGFVPVFAYLIRKAQPYLVGLITILCIVGIYVANFRFFDVGVMIVFGALGYLLRSFGFPLAPLILAVVLGPMVERSLRQSLLLADGGGVIFLTRPISTLFLVLALGVLLSPVGQRLWRLVARRRTMTDI